MTDDEFRKQMISHFTKGTPQQPTEKKSSPSTAPLTEGSDFTTACESVAFPTLEDGLSFRLGYSEPKAQVLNEKKQEVIQSTIDKTKNYLDSLLG